MENVGISAIGYDNNSKLSILKYWQDIIEFDTTIEGLNSSSAFAGLGVLILKALMGNCIHCQCQYGTFSFVNVTD
jgi:hypothetical protein